MSFESDAENELSDSYPSQFGSSPDVVDKMAKALGSEGDSDGDSEHKSERGRAEHKGRDDAPVAKRNRRADRRRRAAVVVDPVVVDREFRRAVDAFGSGKKVADPNNL